MFGKGDGAKVPTAEEEAQAQIKTMREQAKLEAERSAAERARIQAENEAKIAKAGQKQGAAYNLASTYDDQQLNAGGYDPGLVDRYGVSNIYQDTIDRTRAGLAEDDLNPLFGERTAFNDALATATNRYRGDLGKEFDTFAGSGFDTRAFEDTADDAILESILGNQYNDVATRINAARDRGTLNDTGYNKALQKLEEQRLAGRSQLQSLGGGVLSGFRNQLRDFAATERNRLGNASLTSPYDIGGARSGLQSLRDSLSGQLQGKLYETTSGQSFFNPDLIIGYGGANQGNINPSASPVAGGGSPLLSAFLPGAKKANTLTSATGTGVF